MVIGSFLLILLSYYFLYTDIVPMQCFPNCFLLYCRVVQRNLVFVVGLSARLADTEVLKKHEYFGKYGKIHKVVINQSTSYAGAQVRSLCAFSDADKQ